MKSKHPYEEEIEVWEELIKEQEDHDKAKDGVAVFASVEAEQQIRERIKELRRLVESDKAEGLI